MKRILVLAGLLVVFVVSSAFGGSQPQRGEVRSPSGKLLLKTTTRGSKTEARSPSGKLLYKSKTKNGKTEVRSPSGKLLYKVK